ncbi:hypothetical protein TELCIR_09184 [Teladorsagia circumcincta]|uniref:SH2 domain-containing protein n=2 Tax=Teladorsagia circumcincta TaxID=45464 RepID=A0A2G9UFS3_TELCI|nr:hypothetical protein TELCIR_09184 [Teladorsagia circumcincta]
MKQLVSRLFLKKSTHLAFVTDYHGEDRSQCEDEARETIKEALKFMRNHLFELVDLMKRMQYYQTESLQNYRRVVSDDDIIEVQNVDTVEALGDLSAQFHVYYGAEVGRMLDWEAAQKLCVDNGIGEMVARFGITARQLAENLDWKKHDVEQDPARERIRSVYRENVKLYIHPTQKGREHLDETSPVWKMRYVKGKPVSLLEEDEYLYYHQAKVAEHLEIKFVFEKDVDETMPLRNLSDALLAEQPYRVDEYSEVVEEWNSIREKATRMAIDEMVLPFLEKELEEKLLEEAKESVLLKCAKAMYTRLEPAAFQPSEDQLEDEDEDVARQAESMNFFKKFVERRRPHVIGLCGENLESIRLRRDIEECLNAMVADGEISRAPPVYIMDNEAAKVYMLSKGAITEHSGYPPTLLQAISLARLLLDPLWEYAHLWNADDDIFCLNFHPLQSEVSKDDLSNALSREIINRVNEVGVDVNRCLEHPHTANVLQFVCGLGPRKATHLLKMLKQHDHLLESRTKLVTLCRMGPKVFMNCAGFIKIDTTRVAEKTDAYVEVLDGSRVHPETYEWARKMAVDALEVDDSADPTTALEEILQAPDRLKDLDLDAFAEELKRQAECNFTHRQIVHPQFHNVSYREAQRMLGQKDTGDIIIRPSAKSTNRLTISWKVTDGVVANIDVEEHDKEDPTELGRRLTILGEDFDDLDEAIARFLYPMADLCRDVMSHKYFMEGVFSEERDRIDARLREEKRASPARIPYTLTASRTYPAKFVLSYLARVKPCHEYISVTSEGLKFRQKFFSSLDSLLAWFKVHFREPPPGVQHRR